MTAWARSVFPIDTMHELGPTTRNDSETMRCRFYELAKIALLSTGFISITNSVSSSHAQEPFFLVPPSSEQQKAKTAPGPTQASADDLDSIGDTPPPTWRDFPIKGKNSTVPPIILSNGPQNEVFMLGTVQPTLHSTEAGGLPGGGDQKVAKVFNQLDSATQSKKNEEIEEFLKRLPLTWQIAHASQYPLSPILLWRGISEAQTPTKSAPLRGSRSIIDLDSNSVQILKKMEDEPFMLVPEAATEEAADLSNAVTNLILEEPPKLANGSERPNGSEKPDGSEKLGQAPDGLVIEEPRPSAKVSAISPEHSNALVKKRPLTNQGEQKNDDSPTHDASTFLRESMNEGAPVSKRPRTLRVPFDDTKDPGGLFRAELARQRTKDSIIDMGEPEPMSERGTTRSTSASELDQQKGQEAPVIDVRSLSKVAEEQGTDALRASKPATSPKRRIKIEDPLSEEGKIVPPARDDKSNIVDSVDVARLNRCEACLDYYMTHPESTSVRSPWAVMHALLAFEGEYELMHGNQRVNAIGWMCHNGTCRTQRIFTPTKNGFTPNVGGGVQGHQGQFMAILAQCSVPLDYPIQVGTQKYKVEDLVRYEMATCKEKSELTFKLIGLSYYLDSNKQWRANDGKIWSIPKLIQEELSQPIVGAACGGTHRLMGYSFAVKQRELQGLPIDGQYARADRFVKDYIAFTWKLQNSDGSFSTSWYERRGDEPNDERKVQTTGHMLEWLMFSLPDSELNQPRVQKSIDFLLSKIYDNKDYKWPIGPRGHATRAIALYHNRYKEILESQPQLLRTGNKLAAPAAPAPLRRK